MSTKPLSTTSPAMQRILATLGTKPNMSSADLAQEAFVGLSTLSCSGYLGTLRKQRMICVTGWRKTKGQFSTPLYSLGSGPDVPRPKLDETSRNAPGMSVILVILERYGDLDYREIAQRSGMSPHTVKNSGYLAALVAQRKAHISDWKRSPRGPMRPVYSAGPGKAASKPPALTNVEKKRRYREGKKLIVSVGSLVGQLSAALGE